MAVQCSASCRLGSMALVGDMIVLDARSTKSSYFIFSRPWTFALSAAQIVLLSLEGTRPKQSPLVSVPESSDEHCRISYRIFLDGLVTQATLNAVEVGTLKASSSTDRCFWIEVRKILACYRCCKKMSVNEDSNQRPWRSSSSHSTVLTPDYELGK